MGLFFMMNSLLFLVVVLKLCSLIGGLFPAMGLGFCLGGLGTSGGLHERRLTTGLFGTSFGRVVVDLDAHLRARQLTLHVGSASGLLHLDASRLGLALFVEGGLLLGPKRPHRCRVLVGALATLVERHSDRVELLLEPADADAELSTRRQTISDRAALNALIALIALTALQCSFNTQHTTHNTRVVQSVHLRVAELNERALCRAVFARAN